MSTEVGAGHVSVFPAMTGFKKTTRKEFTAAAKEGVAGFDKGVAGAGKKVGTTLGKDVKGAFKQSAGDMGSAGMDRLKKDVAVASREVARARETQRQSASAAKVAELQLQEAWAKYPAGSSQVVRAEEKLDSALRKSSAASAGLKSAQDKLKGAQQGLASTMNAANGQVESSTTKMSTRFKAKLGEMASAAVSKGKEIAGALGSAVKSVATTAVAGVGAAAGVALTKGWGRLTAIDTAQKKLTGLGHSGEAIETIMKNAGAAVKGTSFGLGEAATTAAGAVAAGIKPGTQLENTLKGVANVAAAAGMGMEETGAIFNNVAGNTVAGTDQINQLADRGIPMWQKLADMYGVSVQEAKKMASESKISFEDFEKAATEAAGTVAKEMGNTVPGAFSNLTASLGRIGANLMAGIYPKIAPLIQAATAALEPLEDRARWLGEQLAAKVGPAIDRVTQFLNDLNDSGSEASEKLWSLRGVLGPLALGFTALGVGGLGSIITNLPIIGPLVGGLLGPFGKLGGILGGPLKSGVKEMGMLFKLLPGPLKLIGLGAIAAGAGIAVFSKFGPQINEMISQLASQLPAMLSSIVAAIPGVVETIAAAIPQVIEGIVSAIQTGLPLMIEGMVQLLMALVQAITLILPPLLAALPPLITALISGLLALLPVLLEAAVQLLMALVEAVPLILPPLLAALPSIIKTIVTGLLAMLPQIIKMGVDLLVTLIQGIVQAIPQILEMLPMIITTIVTGLLEMLPEIITAGVEILVAVIAGLVQAIPELIAAIPQIIDAIVDAFGGMDWGQIGSDIIDGIISGVGSMVSSLVSAAKNAAGAALNGIKSFLGIKSPSRVFRDQVGQMMGEGIVVGMERTEGDVKSAARSLVDVVPDVAAQVASVSASNSNDDAKRGNGGGYGKTVNVKQEIHTNDPKLAAAEAAERMRRAGA